MKLYDMMKNLEDLQMVATYAQAGCPEIAREQVDYTISPMEAYERNVQVENGGGMSTTGTDLPAYSLEDKV